MFDTVVDEPPVHVLPTPRALPIGRVEWVVTPTRVYGIDSVGRVFVLWAALPPSQGRRGAFTRFLEQLIGRR